MLPLSARRWRTQPWRPRCCAAWPTAVSTNAADRMRVHRKSGPMRKCCCQNSPQRHSSHPSGRRPRALLPTRVSCGPPDRTPSSAPTPRRAYRCSLRPPARLHGRRRAARRCPFGFAPLANCRDLSRPRLPSHLACPSRTDRSDWIDPNDLGPHPRATPYHWRHVPCPAEHLAFARRGASTRRRGSTDGGRVPSRSDTRPCGQSHGVGRSSGGGSASRPRPGPTRTHCRTHSSTPPSGCSSRDRDRTTSRAANAVVRPRPESGSRSVRR
jgi:hypothetical protein